MRSIILLVAILTAVIVVINARSLGRSVQLDEIPVKIIYDTEPLETVYTKVFVKGMVEPNESLNENNDKQLENKYEVINSPEEVLAVVEEVTKEGNENQEIIVPKDEEVVLPQSDILQVPVNIIPQSDLEVVVKPLNNKPSHKESTITEIVVTLDGAEIKKDEHKGEISQELLPPLVKPSASTEEENNEDGQNELSEVEHSNTVNTANENISEPSTISEQNIAEENNLEAVVPDDQKKHDKDELLYTLRFSESHPAQVPIRKSSGVVNEETKIDSEESSTEAESTSTADATVKPDRPKPFTNIQNAFSNIINTVRPANVVQAIVNRNKGNTDDNNKKDGIKEPEKATVVEESVSTPPRQEDTVTPSSPISSFQTAFNNQVDNFRETVNNALNNLRPTPKPDAEGDVTVNRPFMDALQSTFNNGVNTLSNTVNNAIASFSPQSNDQSIPQQLQNVIQNSLNQFGQSVSSALNLRPRPDTESSDEAQTGQNIAQIIQNALNNFVENINNFNKRPNDEPVQNNEETNPQNQGPFAIALNGLQNFISNFRPSEKPAEAGQASEEGNNSGSNNNNRPNPLQFLQNAGQNLSNFVNNLRPTQKPSTNNKVVPEENINNTDKNQNTENKEEAQNSVNVVEPEKNTKGE